MPAKVFSCLVVSFFCLELFLGNTVFARTDIIAQRMTPHEEAINGFHDLVAFLKSNGLRTLGLERTLAQMVIHEEGTQAAGVVLKEEDNELILTTRRVRYGDFTIFSRDDKVHLILKKQTIDALVTRNFSVVEGAENPIDAAIRGLLNAFISTRHCFRGKKAEATLLADMLTEHILNKISVGFFAQNYMENEARQRQSQITAAASDILTENPQWERCYAALGHLFVTVDFDLLPSGDLLPEGTTIEEEYLSKGVSFSIADTLLPPDQLIIDNATLEINKFFHGMSPPNVLTNRGFSPGLFSSLGCESEMKINFVNPSTRKPAAVSSASLRWFAGVTFPVAAPLPVQLIAKDQHGKIVATDTYHLQEFFFAPASFSLRVFARGQRKIASIETQGVTGNGVCVAFDNLAFWPPL